MASVFLRKNAITNQLCRRQILPSRLILTTSIISLLSIIAIYSLIIHCCLQLSPNFPSIRLPLLERTGEFQHSFNSTCNRGADKRGPHQKVISYAIFGDFSRHDVVLKYLKPSFTEQTIVSTIPHYFPGWTVRIYHNLTTDEAGTEAWQILEKTLQLAHVDLCNATEVIGKRQLGDSFAMTWRWLPLLDEMVDTVMSRDSDSRIIHREVDAVREWLASNKTFHVMRDHPGQCLYGLYPIMGGMWGAKVNQDRQRISLAFERILKLNHEHRYDYDQYLLLEHIWPIAKTNLMAHDSYCCLKYPPSQPFPTRRNKDGLFVGGRELPEEALKDPCPLECRPTSTNATSTAVWDFC